MCYQFAKNAKTLGVGNKASEKDNSLKVLDRILNKSEGAIDSNKVCKPMCLCDVEIKPLSWSRQRIFTKRCTTPSELVKTNKIVGREASEKDKAHVMSKPVIVLSIYRNSLRGLHCRCQIHPVQALAREIVESFAVAVYQIGKYQRVE